MTSQERIERGALVVRRLMREQTCDVRTLELPGFKLWLERQLHRWERDPVFRQRCRLRDLRRANPELRAAEKEQRCAEALDAGSPQFAELTRLERELVGAQRAVAGLTGALHRSLSAKHGALRRKLRTFQLRHRELQALRTALIRSSPERQALLQAEAELKRLRGASGLGREEARLQQLLREQGRRAGGSGGRFEQQAARWTREIIVPSLHRSASEVLVLRGVTFGAARGELDQLIVRLPRTAGRPVDVLAVVEVKRNINDLAHGFRQRQENLAWLTGDEPGYEAADYRTRYFETGHFDREVRHGHEGRTLVFTRESFRLFRRDRASGRFLARLYCVTRRGPVWGLSSAALSRVAHRISTDVQWEPESERCLGRLFAWCRSLAQEVETPDVLRLYAAHATFARQLIIAD